MSKAPLTGMISIARAFLVRDLLFETSYKLQSLFRSVTVLFHVVTFYFLAKLVGGEATSEVLANYGGDYFTFVVIGLSFSGFLTSGLMNFTSSLRQQMTMGVIEAIAVAPIRPVAIFIYSMLWPLGFELLKALFYLWVAVSFLGANIALVRFPLFLASLFLSVLVFGSLGVLAGSLILYFKRGDPIAWFLSVATQLVGGVLFPVSILPGWLQVIAYATPVPYALDALRSSLIPGATAADARESLFALTLFAAFLAPFSLLCAVVLFSKSRARGNLGQF